MNVFAERTMMISSMERAEERCGRCGLGFSRNCEEVVRLERVVRGR